MTAAARLEHVALERHERIATLTLDRPDRRNSLSDPLLQDLITALTQTEGFLPRE